MRWWLLVVAVACDAGEKPASQRPDEVVQAELAKVSRPPTQPIPVKQPPIQPLPPPLSPQPVRGQDELDAVARAVLDRYVHDHDTIPDAGLIAGKPLYLKANLGYPCQWEGCVRDHRIFTAAALPSNKFQLRTRDQLQAESNRSGEFTHYIDITSVEIKGDQATLTVGVDFMMPEKAGGKLCCCSATQVWTRTGGHWKYKATTSTMCS